MNVEVKLSKANHVNIQKYIHKYFIIYQTYLTPYNQIELKQKLSKLFFGRVSPFFNLPITFSSIWIVVTRTHNYFKFFPEFPIHGIHVFSEDLASKIFQIPHGKYLTKNIILLDRHIRQGNIYKSTF